MPINYAQLPPDSTGKKILTRERSILGVSGHEQILGRVGLPTFYIWTGALAYAQDKTFLGIWNPNGGEYVLRIQQLFVVNMQTSSVTGVAVQWDINRLSECLGGTDLTPRAADTDDTWPTTSPNVFTVQSSPTTATVDYTLFSQVMNNDEVNVANTAAFALQQLRLNLIPDHWDVKPLTVRPNRGLGIKMVTNSVVGSAGILAVVTLEGVQPA